MLAASLTHRGGLHGWQRGLLMCSCLMSHVFTCTPRCWIASTTSSSSPRPNTLPHLSLQPPQPKTLQHSGKLYIN